MGLKHRTYLDSSKIYGCMHCKTHLTSLESLISREFNGQHGRAFLFENVVNVDLGEQDDRHMRTGKHTVRDVYCSRCTSYLGWKYDRAFMAAEKYKEGKFILEKTFLDDVQ